MNPDAVFKAYDVRGRTDNGDLDESVYRSIGSSLVSVLGFDRVAVGRDCRRTSLGFFQALAEGVNAAGADVIDLGEVPTDVVYYFSGANRVAGAIITASHNPPEYNGLKLCRPGALPIGTGSGLEEIKAFVTADHGVSVRSGEPGSIHQVDPIDDYLDHLFGIVDGSAMRPLRVAVDGGNGMAGVVIGRVFERLPMELVGLYLEPDGTFPNHPADPLDPANLVDLEALMGDGSFDMGVAFDGDADRAFFLDESGRAMGGSTVTSLIARHLLRGHPGATVVHNLITSKSVPEIVIEAGGVPLRTRVGHSFIKAVMADSGALFGGEHSAHYYFKENFGADSGTLAMLNLMAIVSESGRSLGDLRTDVERYASSGEINFEVDDPQAVIAKVAESVEGGSLDYLDGLTVDFGSEWFNLRPSNTEPLLRLNVEAPTEDRVAALVDYVRMVANESH